MSEVFIAVLNMSLTASYVAAAVILARLLLRKVPKIFSYALWAVVLFRMICPFSFESVLSLLPTNPEPIPQDIVYTQTPTINSGITFIDTVVNRTIQTALPPVQSETVASVNPMQIVITVGAYIWLFGIVILIGYAVISYIRTKRRIFAATLVGDNIFETDRIQTPFVIGFIKPKIYIPVGIDEKETDYIISHERTHIKRGDHFIKVLAFAALSLHWFNPLMWASYILMSKDMELSCDESVMKRSGEDIRANYSNSLLSLSVKQSGLPSPLAFGESNVKTRVKNVLRYKKPAFWISIVAVIAVVFVTVALACNQRTAKVLSAQEALDELKNSINYENGELSFIIPANYPNPTDWNIWIMGTIPMTPYDSNMTWHFAEGDEASLNRTWEAGKQYIISDNTSSFDSLSMNAYLPDGNGNEIELEIDLIPYLNIYTVEDYAAQFVDNQIKSFINELNITVADKEITKFEKAASFDNILGYPVEMWILDYRWKPDDISKIPLAGSMFETDGWISGMNSMGNPVLIFSYEISAPHYLGAASTGAEEWLNFNTLAGKEMILRLFLERINLLPPETYSGNHIIVKFPISTGAICQLLLSQPVNQGNNGIWCVERWKDENGSLYPVAPETDVSMLYYYTELQKQCDNGHRPSLLDPLQMAMEYITGVLGQRITIDDLVPVYSATIEDFANMQTIAEQIPSGSYDEETNTVTWYADLTYDGEDEKIVVELSPPDFENTMCYKISVYDKGDNLIWSDEEISRIHAGNRGYHLYNENGKYYMLYWNPWISGGGASYDYEIFSFGSDGNKISYEKDGLDYNILSYANQNDGKDFFDSPPDEYKALIKKVNSYLSQSFILIDTADTGSLLYSTLDNRIGRLYPVTWDYDFDGDGLADEVLYTQGFITTDGTLINEYSDNVEIMDAYPKLTVNLGNGKSLTKSFINDYPDIQDRLGKYEIADIDGDGLPEIVVMNTTMGSSPNNRIYVLKYNKTKNDFTELYYSTGYNFTINILENYEFTVECNDTSYKSPPNRFYAMPENLFDERGVLTAGLLNGVETGVDGVYGFDIISTDAGLGVEIRQYIWAASHAGQIGDAISVFVWKDGEFTLHSQRFEPYIR